MPVQQTSKSNAMISSLRQRAHSLRRQALWMQQCFMDGKNRRVTPEVVHEIIALKEESLELDRLAARFERRLRCTALPEPVRNKSVAAFLS